MTRAVIRKDLAALWATPLPYVVGVLFHILLALLFIEQLQVREQAVLEPVFPLAGFLLLVMVPVLSMRSFAEESRSGTLDLLLAVPVPVRPLVVGKWLAAWLSTLAVVAPLVAYWALLELYGEPDGGPVVAGFLGLALLSALLAGIGVLTSSLTTSQPIAAVVAVFAVLLLWFSHAGSNAFTAGGVLAHFSLSERLRSFSGGLIDTRDVAFFAVAAAGALLLASLCVQLRRLR